MTKIPGCVFAILGAIVVGFLWLRNHDARVRAEVRQEYLAAESDSLRKEVTMRDSTIAARDRQIEDQKLTIIESQIQLAEAEAAAQKATSVATATLRASLAPHLQRSLDSVVAGYERQLALKDSMLVAQVRLTELAQEQVTNRDSALAVIRKFNIALNAELDVAQREQKRSLYEKAQDALPFIALTLVIERLVD